LGWSDDEAQALTASASKKTKKFSENKDSSLMYLHIRMKIFLRAWFIS
jgi:hypothetical protein